jgi:S1-C subfamily serine protease
MRSTLAVSLVSALVGALAATAYHQTADRFQAAAQEGVVRQPAGSFPQQPPAPSARRLPGGTGDPLATGPTLGAAAAADLADFSPEERTNILVYEKANRSVVHITTKAAQRELLLFEVPSEGSGSGSVLDKQGHVLTNFHVVEGAQSIRVTLFDGESYDARLVGSDPPNDVAILRVNAPADSLIPLELGDSAKLRVGQIVFAIGNPFGLERTMTTGIISSLNRNLPSKAGRQMKSIIQIDAALNRGNSGGPLLDTRGRLIGMNTAIASSTGQNTGVGFAIPVDTVRRVAPQLIARGKVVRPDAGINRVVQTDEGLLVVTVAAGGPAERAGLRGFNVVRETKRRGPFYYEERRIDRSQADLIVAVDGERITTADEFLTLVERRTPGERIVLTIARDGRLVDVPLTLGSGE